MNCGQAYEICEQLSDPHLARIMATIREQADREAVLLTAAQLHMMGILITRVFLSGQVAGGAVTEHRPGYALGLLDALQKTNEAGQARSKHTAEQLRTAHDFLADTQQLYQSLKAALAQATPE